MKNRELIEHINALAALKDKAKDKPILSPVVMLYVSRNLRNMVAEYNTNYVKDLAEIRDRYIDTKRVDVTIPATETEPEHVEQTTQQTWKPGISVEAYEKEINALLDMEADVKILKVGIEAISSLVEWDDIDAIEFMVE